jgi:hypothetical protein
MNHDQSNTNPYVARRNADRETWLAEDPIRARQWAAEFTALVEAWAPKNVRNATQLASEYIRLADQWAELRQRWVDGPPPDDEDIAAHEEASLRRQLHELGERLARLQRYAQWLQAFQQVFGISWDDAHKRVAQALETKGGSRYTADLAIFEEHAGARD